MGGHSGKYDMAICYAIPPVTQGTLLPVEEEFYTKFNSPSVMLERAAQFATSTASDILNCIVDRWTKATTKPAETAAFYHDNYSGWFNSDATVDSKSAIAVWHAEAVASKMTQFVKISPMSVVVEGDTAVAHYNYLWIFQTKDNRRIKEFGRYSETFVKVGGKWLLFADSGGPQ
jgi:hypothetical protein